jgi:hypothetical protein
MAWLLLHLVQLVIFWTSKALTYAKCQHFNQGYCCLLQGQQLSYIVLDNWENWFDNYSRAPAEEIKNALACLNQKKIKTIDEICNVNLFTNS